MTKEAGKPLDALRERLNKFRTKLREMSGMVVPISCVLEELDHALAALPAGRQAHAEAAPAPPCRTCGHAIHFAGECTSCDCQFGFPASGHAEVAPREAIQARDRQWCEALAKIDVAARAEYGGEIHVASGHGVADEWTARMDEHGILCRECQHLPNGEMTYRCERRLELEKKASGHSEPAPGLLELIKEVRDEYALALLDPEHSSRLAFEQFIGDLGELLARAALTAPPASGLREAVIEECCRAVCRYCEFASKPDSRWSKANSNGKHFDENVREEYCDAYPIRRYTRRAALTAPPAEAQGVQEQRESGKEK